MADRPNIHTEVTPWLLLLPMSACPAALAAAQCPAEAIDMGDLHYEIDAEKCLECGACAAQCPAEAIVQE